MVETVEKSFEDFFLSEEMLKALRTVGYKRPTPVQAESIPLILAGIDLIVQSHTGSGKTAAFAVPATDMLEANPGRIEVLVLAPTRELAKQSAAEFERLGQYKELSATAIYGGASYETQLEALKTAQIVTATPGRLLDLAKRGDIDLSTLRIFCLDEADEMLSMGFREELNAIVDFLPKERQSLLFSATVNSEIQALAKGMLYYPEYISLSGDQVAAAAVTHLYYRVAGMGRKRDLVRVIQFERPDSAIIFCNTRNDTFEVTEYLQQAGYRAKVLNGDLPQNQREATLAELRNGTVDFIVATDVAARGIDITDLTHVINYTLPSSAETYVHRTGRTGRAGKKGRAITLLAPAEMATHFDIMSLYDIEIEQRQLPTDKEVQQAQAVDRLDSLVSDVMAMKDVSGEATLALATTLLSAHAENPGAEPELDSVLAKLLALADMVLRDPKIADIVTGRAPLVAPAKAEPKKDAAEKAAPAKTPEAVEPKEEAAPAKAPTPEASESGRSKRRSNRKSRSKSSSSSRRSSKAHAETKSETKTEAKTETESNEPRRRRRRRSRGAKTTTPSSSSVSTVTPEVDTPEEPSASKRRSTGARRRQPVEDAEESRGNRSRRRKRSSGGSKSSKSSKRSRGSKSSKSSRGSKSSKRSRGSRSSKSTRDNKRSRGNKRSRRNERSSGSAASTASTPTFDTSKMYLNVGRDHVEDSKELLEMICYMSGFDTEDFADISVQSSYSFVQVRQSYFYDIINAINNQEWKGVSISAEPARK
ncbi:DEAD/DEAH box helicase [Bradymonas sediminis]|uniref:DEAD/DEAH box helicase n=1 Tax=Bradymonas sediminis TaxID=1548548 RepID=UPI00105FAE6C|nr:DEAD/DEAH box helicase [Bradymonas sediminis]TDP73596.1 ATP-dependent RNA helicase DeaD [Bradymonas sediminis]